MTAPPRPGRADLALKLGAVAVGAALLGLTYPLLAPAVSSPGAKATTARAAVPALRYDAWYALPAQQSRTMPLQTACTDAVRQITGRARFEGLDPVAVVLAWVLTGGRGAGAGWTDWEKYPFLLCEHRGLRGQIFSHRGETADLAGKYACPAELRESPGFDQLLDRVSAARQEHGARAHLYLTEEELQAEEVGRRLVLYDALCGRPSTPLYANALVGEKYLDLRRQAEVENTTPAEALRRLEQRAALHPDPLHLVGLDRAPGSAWFSRGELLALRADPRRWQQALRRRQEEAPELYCAADHRRQVQEFQDRLGAGEGPQLLEELRSDLQERREDRLRRFTEADGGGDTARANVLFYQIVRTAADQERLQQVRERARRAGAGAEALRAELGNELRAIAEKADKRVLDRLAAEFARVGTGPGVSENPEVRLLCLDYLEARFPDLYKAAPAQPFPAEEVALVLNAFAAVQRAYRAADADLFDTQSQELFRTLQETTDAAALAAGADRRPYPGTSTIGIELLFNRCQPFRWAWVLMLAAAAAFLAGLASRPAYVAGFVLAAASLLLQAAGFAARIAISGWAPVSNMYETVIFAAFMAALFALVLELVYRRGVFGLAGAAVATMGLLLADGLPLGLDPKINPLVPVLRTNYWLTVHVLTIVCGYGAGALAWGLGNLSLALLAFGRGRRESLHTLAQLTYRSMQLTVLLLAAGTFLGGWWAAQAWGRFWGWDPKEVGALVALVCYVVPLHARYVGWVKEYGLAVWAVLCFGAILLSWYVLNFVLAAGLHSYGFGAGGGRWVLWAVLLNVEWLLVATSLYRAKLRLAKGTVPESAVQGSA
jgi:ABC-type transport system involved in cytochrome c biogenesis permease subunit